MEAILKNFEQGIKDGLAKAREANTVEPVVVFPAQCECGHLFRYHERYMLPQERKDGCIAFCWCGFCRTRRDVFGPNACLQGCERSEHTLQGVVRHSDSGGEA